MADADQLPDPTSPVHSVPSAAVANVADQVDYGAMGDNNASSPQPSLVNYGAVGDANASSPQPSLVNYGAVGDANTSSPQTYLVDYGAMGYTNASSQADYGAMGDTNTSSPQPPHVDYGVLGDASTSIQPSAVYDDNSNYSVVIGELPDLMDRRSRRGIVKNITLQYKVGTFRRRLYARIKIIQRPLAQSIRERIQDDIGHGVLPTSTTTGQLPENCSSQSLHGENSSGQLQEDSSNDVQDVASQSIHGKNSSGQLQEDSSNDVQDVASQSIHGENSSGQLQDSCNDIQDVDINTMPDGKSTSNVEIPDKVIPPRKLDTGSEPKSDGEQ